MELAPAPLSVTESVVVVSAAPSRVWAAADAPAAVVVAEVPDALDLLLEPHAEATSTTAASSPAVSPVLDLVEPIRRSKPTPKLLLIPT
jgi:hypothetical protein